jgi:hypothetical protein
MTANQTKLLTCETYYWCANCYTYSYILSPRQNNHKKTQVHDEYCNDNYRWKFSAVTLAAAAQQALQEINESGLVETVRQPYTTFKRIQKVLETLI